MLTIFLIIASVLITKSCPHLEDRLLRTKLFAPYLPYVYGNAPMPRRARISATVAMWICVLASLTILHLTADPSPWLTGLIAGLAGIGTWCVWRFRRGTPAAAAERA